MAKIELTSGGGAKVNNKPLSSEQYGTYKGLSNNAKSTFLKTTPVELNQQNVKGMDLTQFSKYAASGNVSAPPEVNATTLGTENLTVPSAPTTNLTDQAAQLEASATNLQTETPEATGTTEPSTRDQVLQNLIDFQSDSLAVSPETQALQTESAIAQKAAKDLANDLTAYAKQTRENIMAMRRNPEGKSRGALESQMSNYEYERYNQKDGLADMAIAAQYAQNNAEMAYNIAKNAVDAEDKQYNRTIDFYNSLYTMLGDDMTDSEAEAYQSTLRIYENEVKNFMDTKSAVLDLATANNAPLDVLKEIRSATSSDDVWIAARGYTKDPQLAIQEGNLAVSWARLAQDKENADRLYALELLKQNGDISAAEAEDKKNISNTIRETTKLLQATREAVANKSGLKASLGSMKNGWGSGLAYAVPSGIAGATGGSVFGPVGTVVGGVTGFAAGGYSGAKGAQVNAEDFKNDIKTIVAGQALTELANLSVSLSPISNAEIQLVAAKASDLAGSFNQREDGSIELTGTEGEFISNLEEYQTQLVTALEALAEDPAAQELMLAGDLDLLTQVLEEQTAQ